MFTLLSRSFRLGMIFELPGILFFKKKVYFGG